MKAKLVLFIVFSFVIVGCGGEDPDQAIQHQLAVIKISPEMQEQVFVSPIVDSCVVDYSKVNLNTLYYGDGLVLCNPTPEDSIYAEFAQSHLKIAGTNPYILLDNEYAVIDWKWANFHPLSGNFRHAVYSSPKIYDNKMAKNVYSTNFNYLNGFLANEEYYLLPITWKEVTKLRTVWPMESGQRIDKPEVRYVNVKDIEKYSSLKRLNRYLYDVNHAQQVYLNNPEEFHAYIEQNDRILSVYVEVLNKMINNNDFEKWTITYK